MATKKAATKKTATKKTATKKTATKKTATKKTATKKTPRPTPSVSPLRGMSIDAWIAQYTKGWQTEVVRRVIEIVGEAAPESVASIKWRMPVFELQGPFLFVRTAKAHLTVGFWRGSELDAPIGGFVRGDRMGHFKLHRPSDLDERALAVMVKSAVRSNREKGSPAVRGAT